jgi:Domain of unknown function (DUF4440)
VKRSHARTRAILALTLALLASCHQTGPSDVLRPSDTFVLDLVRRYDAARTGGDTASVARMLAPGFQLITARGEVLSRGETLDRIAADAARGDTGSRSDVTVKLFQRAILVVSRWQGAGPAGLPPGAQRCTMVWVLRKVGWQSVLDQCSVVSPESP